MGQFSPAISVNYTPAVTYEQVHREMQKSGVTLSLLWVEYCGQCRAAGELPYQSTQFNKYYADYVHKTKATMHLEHKPGETIQVDWAGQTAGIVDTDTGELIPAYISLSLFSRTADTRMWKRFWMKSRRHGSQRMSTHTSSTAA